MEQLKQLLHFHVSIPQIKSSGLNLFVLVHAARGKLVFCQAYSPSLKSAENTVFSRRAAIF